MRKDTDGSGNEKVELSIARKESVQRMQDAVAAMVDGGTSPRARGIEHATEALSWIYIWGWTTSTILGHVTGIARGTVLAKRLEKNGWIKRVPIRIISSFRVVPSDVITITHEGVAELTTLLGELPRTTKSPWIGRVPKKDLIHDLLVQQLTLEYMGRIPGADLDPAIIEEHGLVKSYRTPLHPEVDTGEGKKVDAIWIMSDGCRLAVEVELSPKWDRELDQFISGHRELQRREHNSVWGLVVFFGSKKTAERYSKAMLPGAQVKPWIWTKEERKWYPGMITPRDIVDVGFMSYAVVLPSPRREIRKDTEGSTDNAEAVTSLEHQEDA